MKKHIDVTNYPELAEALKSLGEDEKLFLRLNGRIIAEVISVKESADEE